MCQQPNGDQVSRWILKKAKTFPLAFLALLIVNLSGWEDLKPVYAGAIKGLTYIVGFDRDIGVCEFFLEEKSPNKSGALHKLILISSDEDGRREIKLHQPIDSAHTPFWLSNLNDLRTYHNDATFYGLTDLSSDSLTVLVCGPETVADIDRTTALKICTESLYYRQMYWGILGISLFLTFVGLLIILPYPNWHSLDNPRNSA